MKILLCHLYFLAEDVKEHQIMKLYPPLGLLYISSHLSAQNMPHEVFDGTFSSRANFLSKIESDQPEVLGIYCNLMTKVNVLSVVAQIKKKNPDIKIILGGPDVRHNVKDYLHHGADYLVLGEGELTFYELIQSLQGHLSLDEVAGIAYLKDGQAVENPARVLMKNLDDLGLPAYHQIDLPKYLDTWKKFHGQTMLSVSTQRGCPYTCKWCSTAVYGQSYRRRSPEKVVEDLMFLKATYNPDAVWFVDDVFTVSHKWLAAFDAALKKQNFTLPFECITRADRLNEETVELLKSAGCFRVWIGAESGSQKILDAMDRRVQVDQVRNMIQSVKKKGMEAGTFIMLGYPGETQEDIDETARHLINCDPDFYTLTLAYPIKGTALFEEVEGISNELANWASQTDRDRTFKRTYQAGYYKHALRRVINEVELKKESAQKNPWMQRMKHLVKWKVAATQMKFYT